MFESKKYIKFSFFAFHVQSFADFKVNYTLLSLHKKMKFSIKDFFSKCNHICRKLRIWSHLLKKSLMEKFIFLSMVSYLIENSQGKCRKSSLEIMSENTATKIIQ